MKKYKLLKDLPTAKAGSIFEVRNGGLYDPDTNHFVYNLITLKKFGTFDEWFEEIEESKAWKPEERGEYYYINYSGSAFLDIYDSGELDSCLFEIGNCFKTKEDAEKAIEKLKALRRLREKGLRFDGTKWRNHYYEDNHFTIKSHFDGELDNLADINEDLSMLFYEESEDEN